jgi:ectoine hydroxylase-related dioxygenase (phytanoyl-CoA dioxygenase family)
MNGGATGENESVLSESISKIATDGFVLLKQLCSEEMVAAILDVSRRKSREIRNALGAREIGIGSAAGYEEIVQRSPGRWDVPISPREFGLDDKQMPWWPLIAAVLGENAEHSFSGVVSSEPGSPAQFWHIDSPHTDVEHRPAHAINVLLALHDVPMEMGPTECAAGSHVLNNHLKNTNLVTAELIYQHAGTTPETLVTETDNPVPELCATSMLAGSCLVFDDRLLHRGLANDSNSIRHVAYFSYRQKGYSENTHFESQRSVFDSKP